MFTIPRAYQASTASRRCQLAWALTEVVERLEGEGKMTCKCRKESWECSTYPFEPTRKTCRIAHTTSYLRGYSEGTVQDRKTRKGQGWKHTEDEKRSRRAESPT